MKRIALAALFALTTTAFAMPAAYACGHDMAIDEAELDWGNSVATAEEQLNGSAYAEAIREAVSAHPLLGRRSMKWKKSDDAEVRRGAMVVAVATVRLDGKVYLSKTAKTTRSKSVAKKNLRWARKTLTALHTADRDDVEIKAYWAEAMATSSGAKDRAKAKGALMELAKEDLLTSGQAWAALAKLHKEAGATSEHDAAVSRCMAMSGDDAQMCGSPMEQAALN
jgi:hypothetical protein